MTMASELVFFYRKSKYNRYLVVVIARFYLNVKSTLLKTSILDLSDRV